MKYKSDHWNKNMAIYAKQEE